MTRQEGCANGGSKAGFPFVAIFCGFQKQLSVVFQNASQTVISKMCV